jgi:3-keto-disaccharide hydrolase
MQILVISVVAFAVGCNPATEPQEVAEEAPAQWIELFDGETLNGWEDPAAENPPGDSWIIEDGCIKAVGRPTLREDLFTNEHFGDFELVFEWKISEKGNSGVKYRVQDRAVLVKGKTNPDAKRFEDIVDYELTNRLNDRNKLEPGDSMEEYVVAFEHQIIDNEGHRDALNGPDRSTGAVYSMIAPTSQEAKPVGEFNESKIVLRGNHVEHWLNGVNVVDADLTSEPIRAGLEKRWTTESPVYKLLTEMPRQDGPIGLQHHNDEAWFRNIRIRRLD